MAKNPYTLLGVKKDATESEIRKAFRKLSKKYHPDVAGDDAGAEDKFKEISAAYTLLSDPDLRKQYDEGRVDAQGNQKAPDFAGGFRGGQGFGGQGFGGFGGGQSFEGFRTQAGGVGGDDMADLFSSLFGMNVGGMGGGMGGFGSRQQTGGFDRSAYTRPRKGADIAYALTLDFMDAVRGTTKRIIARDGSSLNVRIPAGVKDGQTLRLKGKGEAGAYGGARGDARVTVSVRPHKHFRREGDDLHLRLPVALQEAVLGAKVTVPTPTGDVRLSLPPGTQGGQVFRLRGKGVRDGALFVRAEIQVPDDPSLREWAEAHPAEDAQGLREGLV